MPTRGSNRLNVVSLENDFILDLLRTEDFNSRNHVAYTLNLLAKEVVDLDFTVVFVD